MKNNKKNMFIIILSMIISFFSSITLNINSIDAKVDNIDYANYPSGYSLYKLLQDENYVDFMEDNFPNFNYKSYLFSTAQFTTNLEFDDLEIKILGCESDFECYPIPSCYSESINISKIKYGSSFDSVDILQKSNAIVMYESHIKKIGLGDNDYIMIKGVKFYIKGVLEDNSDIKRNIGENIIQIFIPNSTYRDIFEYFNVATVIYTDDTNFTNLDDDPNYLSEYKANASIKRLENYYISNSLVALVTFSLVSFISFIIIQIILVKSRYNEIGIRRAVGASRSDIIYMFTKTTFISSITGVCIGFIIYLITFTMFLLYLSLKLFANLFIYNLNTIFIFLLVYLFVCFVSILISTIIGTRINIASILVEEK